MGIEGLSLLFVLVIAGLSGAYIYLYHQNTKTLVIRIHEAWKYAVGVDQSSRKLSEVERAAFLSYIEKLAAWNTQLVGQCQQSAAREIDEVRRYMSVVQRDLTAAVRNAAAESLPKTRVALHGDNRETPASGTPAAEGK